LQPQTYHRKREESREVRTVAKEVSERQIEWNLLEAADQLAGIVPE